MSINGPPPHLPADLSMGFINKDASYYGLGFTNAVGRSVSYQKANAEQPVNTGLVGFVSNQTGAALSYDPMMGEEFAYFIGLNNGYSLETFDLTAIPSEPALSFNHNFAIGKITLHVSSTSAQFLKVVPHFFDESLPTPSWVPVPGEHYPSEAPALLSTHGHVEFVPYAPIAPKTSLVFQLVGKVNNDSLADGSGFHVQLLFNA